MQELVLHEVGLRDGLQIEKQTVPTEQKIRWVEQLRSSGLDVIQLGSFVHPERVPQMADTDRLFAHFKSARKGESSPILSGLVLNEKGFDRGLACGVEQFCMGVSASDTHSRKNTGMGTEEALARILPIARKALEAGRSVQVSVQSAFGCGFEGEVPRERVLDIVSRFLDGGMRIISLADTAGYGTPDVVESLFADIRALNSSVELACHFHDTYGLAMANAFAAMRAGVRYFEAAFGGLGGCPFTAVTAGNLCTEDFIHALQRMGHRKDIRLEPIIEVAAEASRFFQRPLPGTVLRAGPIRLRDQEKAS